MRPLSALPGLISAMKHLRAVMKLSGDGTGHYLREAQPQHRYMIIPDFNDACGCYDDIQSPIDEGRALAEAELADAEAAVPPIRCGFRGKSPGIPG